MFSFKARGKNELLAVDVLLYDISIPNITYINIVIKLYICIYLVVVVLGIVHSLGPSEYLMDHIPE
jgi:hypothetical protein